MSGYANCIIGWKTVKSVRWIVHHNNKRLKPLKIFDETGSTSRTVHNIPHVPMLWLTSPRTLLILWYRGQVYVVNYKIWFKSIYLYTLYHLLRKEKKNKIIVHCVLTTTREKNPTWKEFMYTHRQRQVWSDHKQPQNGDHCLINIHTNVKSISTYIV